MSPKFVEACWLVKHGVPFHVVFGEVARINDIERAAMAINFSIFEGAEFDWNAMRFKDRS